MSLRYPEMLWCLFALLIPIIIHLFNLRRYRNTYFSDVELLSQIEQQTAKTQKLKHRVVLALRCLFITTLVIAFAKPQNAENNDLMDSKGSVMTAIYIDNSMSMNSMSDKTTLLADARETASSLVEKMGHNNRFVLLTNNFELQNEHPMNRDDMIEHINKMQVEGSPVTLSTVLARAESIARQNGFEKANIFIESDFQTNTLDMGTKRQTMIENVVIVPFMSSNNSNIYIDTLWLDSPIIQKNLSNTLNISVINDSDADISALPISFFIDSTLVATASTDITAHSDAMLKMQFLLEENGTHRCRVELSDYPITFDNEYKFVMQSDESLKVVEIADAPSQVTNVFNGDKQFSYLCTQAHNPDYTALKEAHMIILNTSKELTTTLCQTLVESMSEGRSVIAFPSEESHNLDPFLVQCGQKIKSTDTATMMVENISKHNTFYTDVLLNVPQYADLPKVMKYSVLQPDASTATLMTLQNGLPFLVDRPVGKGHLYLFAVSLDERCSTLTNNSVFVPLLVKMTLSGSAVSDVSHTIGQDGMIRVISDAQIGNLFRVKCRENGFESVVNPIERNGTIYLPLGDMVLQQGFYDITAGDKHVATTAWNDSRSESVMEFATPEKVAEELDRLGYNTLLIESNINGEAMLSGGLTKGFAYDIVFLVLALLCLVGETLVLRLWK